MRLRRPSNELAKARALSGFRNIREAAAAVGCHPGTLSALERGVSRPSEALMRTVANAYKLDYSVAVEMWRRASKDWDSWRRELRETL